MFARSTDNKKIDDTINKNVPKEKNSENSWFNKNTVSIDIANEFTDDKPLKELFSCRKKPLSNKTFGRPLAYSLSKLSDLISIVLSGTVVNARNDAIRYLTDHTGTLWFGLEGLPGSKIPSHLQLCTGKSCLAAGTIFLDEIGNFYGIDNQSGEFETPFVNMKITLATLFFHEQKLPKDFLPSTIEIKKITDYNKLAGTINVSKQMLVQILNQFTADNKHLIDNQRDEVIQVLSLSAMSKRNYNNSDKLNITDTNTTNYPKKLESKARRLNFSNMSACLSSSNPATDDNEEINAALLKTESLSSRDFLPETSDDIKNSQQFFEKSKHSNHIGDEQQLNNLLESWHIYTEIASVDDTLLQDDKSLVQDKKRKRDRQSDQTHYSSSKKINANTPFTNFVSQSMVDASLEATKVNWNSFFKQDIINSSNDISDEKMAIADSISLLK